ncbi:hypothetical protein Tco_1094337 [Tanacetum coccineum]|uniref:Uncharacterized protein n=1 Tax=Tanacetum coccineum TaxID=301880 RepID=A0ABQ5IGJ9_9ASTR
MTRSLTKELFTPFKDPEQEFRSSRKLFKTLSLDESRSPKFDLFSDLEENYEEEYCPRARNAKKMEEINNFQQEPDETLYQEFPTRQILNSKGSIPTKTVIDAKVAIQEMAKYSQKWHNGTSKTRSTKTSDGLAAIQAQLNNLGREIKKVNEKVYATQVGCEKYKGAAALGFYQRNNANPSYQEQRQFMEETLSKFMSESTKRHEENFNMIKEIRASTDAAVRNQSASIKTLEIQIRQISKIVYDTVTLFRIYQYALSAQQNSKLIFESRQVTIPFPIRLNNYDCDEKKGSYGLQCLDAYSYRATRVDDSLPRKEKDPGSFTLPCYINIVCFENALTDLGASISVMLLSTYSI